MEVGNVSSQFENPGKNGGGKFFLIHKNQTKDDIPIPETNSN